MEKLIEKFSLIASENIYTDDYNRTDLLNDCANLCKEIACEFAVYLVDERHDKSLYTPQTFENSFNKFLEKYEKDN